LFSFNLHLSFNQTPMEPTYSNSYVPFNCPQKRSIYCSLHQIWELISKVIYVTWHLSHYLELPSDMVHKLQSFHKAQRRVDKYHANSISFLFEFRLKIQLRKNYMAYHYSILNLDCRSEKYCKSDHINP